MYLLFHPYSEKIVGIFIELIDLVLWISQIYRGLQSVNIYALIFVFALFECLNVNTFRDIIIIKILFRYLRRFDGEIEKEEVPKTLKRHLSTSTFQDYKTKFLIEKEKQEYEAGGLGK